MMREARNLEICTTCMSCTTCMAGFDWVISLYFSSYGKIKAVVSPRCGEDDAFVVAIDIVLYYSFKLQAVLIF